jgi:hypothetical protein
MRASPRRNEERGKRPRGQRRLPRVRRGKTMMLTGSRRRRDVRRTSTTASRSNSDVRTPRRRDQETGTREIMQGTAGVTMDQNNMERMTVIAEQPRREPYRNTNEEATESEIGIDLQDDSTDLLIDVVKGLMTTIHLETYGRGSTRECMSEGMYRGGVVVFCTARLSSPPSHVPISPSV